MHFVTEIAERGRKSEGRLRITNLRPVEDTHAAGSGQNAPVSLGEIKTAIERLSFEERAQLAAWLHRWKDDEWDEQVKRDVSEGQLDDVLSEVEDGIAAGRLRSEPDWH